jgi:hypothetical protein
MMRRFFFHAVALALASLPLAADDVLAQGEYATRYELGGQFTSLSRSEPTSQSSPFTGRRTETEPGFGGRFTYNVTNEIAFEVELNSLPKQRADFGVPTGRVYQGQFGVKAGKRFRRFGLYGKLRPGFVGFSKVSRFTGSRPAVVVVPFIGEFHFNIPEFGKKRETYASVDVGAVVEFYPSRRIVTRLDLGDTMIRYDLYREVANDVCSFFCIDRIYERPAEMRHNLQFSAGVAVRF